MNNNNTVNMDDIDSPLNQDDSIVSDVTSTHKKPLVSAPRPWWFEFVFGLLTFTISWSFWAVARARDVKNMRSNDYTPWLWFFVPLVPLAQLFAFPKMFSELRNIEGDRVNPAWKETGGLWVAAIFISGLFSNVPDDYYGDWWLGFSLLTGHILLCFLHHRFSRLKQHDEQYLEFTGRRSWYAWWEWLLMSIFVLAAIGVGYLFWDEQKSIIDDLPKNYHYQNNEHGFQLDVNGKDWQEMVIGTYSDGSAIVEFSNVSGGAYILIFKHGKDESLNSLATFRHKDMAPDFNSTPTCREIRELDKDQDSVVSVSTCTAEVGSDHEMSISKLIQVEEHYYELLGFAVEAKRPYKKTKKTLLDASHSFSEIAIEVEK